jgi:hypothetical protein
MRLRSPLISKSITTTISAEQAATYRRVSDVAAQVVIGTAKTATTRTSFFCF